LDTRTIGKPDLSSRKHHYKSTGSSDKRAGTTSKDIGRPHVVEVADDEFMMMHGRGGAYSYHNDIKCSAVIEEGYSQ